MANTSRVNGFRPVKYMNGKPYMGDANIYEIAVGDAAALAVGDLTILSDQAATDAYPAAERFGTSGAQTAGFGVGVVVGFVVDPLNLNTPQYRVASTKRFALIADATDLVMEVEEDSVGGSIALASIGLNSGFMADASAQLAVTGASGMMLDSSSVAVTATLPLRILGQSRKVDNEQGTAGRWLVSWNLHQYAVTGVATGSLGV
jgi:hypothetical protein